MQKMRGGENKKQKKHYKTCRNNLESSTEHLCMTCATKGLKSSKSMLTCSLVCERHFCSSALQQEDSRTQTRVISSSSDPSLAAQHIFHATGLSSFRKSTFQLQPETHLNIPKSPALTFFFFFILFFVMDVVSGVGRI